LKSGDMMNRNVFKFIAAFAMVADHVGAVILESDSLIYLILRSIGRIAFVMFAYMIAEGFFKTKNIRSYFLRILVFALVIETFFLIYSLSTGVNYTLLGNSQNVIWPLVFGLASLWLISHKIIWIRFLSVGIVLLAGYLNIPYGSYGVMIIMMFGLYPNFLTQVFFMIALNLIFIEYPLMHYVGMTDFARYNGVEWIQWFSLLAFIFIYFYNGKKGKLNTKWFFYIFYPVHLGLIYLIDFLIK